MTLTLRAPTADDADAMSKVLVASITELCSADHVDDSGAISAWTRNKSPEGVLDLLANAKIQIFVADRDGEIIAVGAISFPATIALNYVSPTARFQGVSKALLTHMEQVLIAQGQQEAFLEATATALKFYERMGWHTNGPQATGRRVNGYPMSKALTS
jgi:predicted GNAT family acetyltransferase